MCQRFSGLYFVKDDMRVLVAAIPADSHKEAGRVVECLRKRESALAPASDSPTYTIEWPILTHHLDIRDESFKQIYPTEEERAIICKMVKLICLMEIEYVDSAIGLGCVEKDSVIRLYAIYESRDRPPSVEIDNWPVNHDGAGWL